MLLPALLMAALPIASLEDRTLSFGCDDIVVVGRVVSRAYTPLPSDGWPLGSGSISGKVTVRRVLRGGHIQRVLPVEYLAHTYMRDDKDFMLVLHRSKAGAYEIEHAQVMSLQPVLSPSCVASE